MPFARQLIWSGLVLLSWSLASPSLHASNAQDAPWRVDFAAAEIEAREADVPLVLFFTGSDWCVWCQKLEAELFAQDGFRAAAGEAFIPVMLDFPRRNSQLLRNERQNRRLQQRFRVEAFPTVIWLHPQTGAELHRHGYVEMTVKDYLQGLAAAVQPK